MGKDLKGKELGKGIIQRKDGRYEARYVDRFGLRRSICDRSLTELKNKLAEAVYDNQKEHSLVQNISLDQWFEKWMDIYKRDTVRPNTIRHYAETYRLKIKPKIGKMKLKDIKNCHVKELLNGIKRNGYSTEVQIKVRNILADMFDKAIQNDYANKNPAKGIKICKDKDKEVRALSTDEQVAFFECSKGTFYDNLFVTAVMTGMRIGELAGLKWEDIDFDRKVINVKRTLVYAQYETDTKKTFHFEEPKTNTSKRSIPINRETEISLKKQYLQRQVVRDKNAVQKDKKEFDDLLFVTSVNRPICPQTANDAIERIVNEVNSTRSTLDQIEPFSSHCFRHTFATRCFEAGIKPKTIQGYLGHASLQMTMDLYARLFPDFMEEEMKKLELSIDEINRLSEENFYKILDGVGNYQIINIDCHLDKTAAKSRNKVASIL